MDLICICLAAYLLDLAIYLFFAWACAPEWSAEEQQRFIDEMLGIQL